MKVAQEEAAEAETLGNRRGDGREPWKGATRDVDQPVAWAVAPFPGAFLRRRTETQDFVLG